MQKLNPNWITEGIIDFEYKKYILLAYLQHVNKNFNKQKLYPFLPELIFHYQNMISLKKNKEAVFDSFPKKITKIDFEKFVIEYEKTIQDDDYIEDINNIIDFAIPKVKQYLNEGKELYESFEDKLNIFPVGIVALYKDEGYLILKKDQKKDTLVYEYKMSIFENENEKYRGLHINLIKSCQTSITYTYESIKSDLARSNTKFNNPATYAIESPLALPLEETLLPIAKRILVRYITNST